jgi:hypothetical protein
MAEIVVTLLLFGVVIVITALVFGAWLIFSVIRLVFRGAGALIGNASPHRRVQQLTGMSTVKCPNARCRSANPVVARYCRRCGRALPAPQSVGVRRAAMW